MLKKTLISLLVVACMASCQPAETAWQGETQDPVFLHRTIKKITDIIVHDIFSPPVASRVYVYTSVAAYEAARHDSPEFYTLAGQLHGLTPVPAPQADQPYCFPLAAVKASLVVGHALIFSEEMLDTYERSVMQQFQASGIPSDVFERSIAYGTQVAEHVLAWANTDHYKQTRSYPKYTVVEDPSTWQPTPPAYMDGIEPHWNKIRTMLIDSASQFMPPPPTSFSPQEGSSFYKEALEVYTVGNGLNEEQENIGRFWDCNPFMMNVKGHVMFATKKISPGGHWINITHVACVKAQASFVASAEAYARVAVALFDAFISCWDEKYRSNLVRPETYINRYIDEDWTPLLQTPPFPEYTSGHSVVSGAASVILTHQLGTPFAFIDSTEVEFGLSVRSYQSFVEASAEAAISRLYGGIHYRPACDLGLEQGRSLGAFIAQKLVTRKTSPAVDR